MLQVHGDPDRTILYGGSVSYPSAAQTVAIWAPKNLCAGVLEPSGVDKDLDLRVPGPETRIESYESCPPGGAVDLWTITGGGHIPGLGAPWGDEVWSYFSSHPKP